MRFVALLIFLFLHALCYAQLNIPCNNWLNTPSYQSYVSAGDLDIPGNQVTVEAIFTRTTPYSGDYNWAGDIVSKHVDPTDVNYLLRPNNAQVTTTNGNFSTPPTCEIELNKTYHAAMTYDGTTLKFYRNGFLMSSIPATGNLIQNNHQTRIGLYDGNLLFNTNFIGYINEVRIWNVSRTQSQIRAFMNNTLPSPTTQTGLLAYYTFDNLLNKQGNPAWNGTLGGAAVINSVNTSCSFAPDSCYVPNPISNIINDYTPVLALEPCNNKITVENAAAFNVGDTVLMIQMKGAAIDSTNTAAFGTITDYKNAGNYEFNYVKSKSGNIIELKNVLLRGYDIPLGKVQLIRVPYYTNATVTAPLTCLPWDGSKGGVLVLNVADSVVLNANIDVSGKGFRGGNDPVTVPGSFNCYENQFFYPVNPDLASEKGEGIAVISPSKSFGKGALASGGGSGNSHNSGGGGGSNGNTGGFGGYNFEGSPCDGTVPFDNRGIGGKPLSYSNALNKIFMGGGGGAGHSNNPQGFQAKGGNGSGIIIIMANKLKVNSNRIIANGNDGAPCAGGGIGCHEGMGGGGAGGSALLKINTYLDNTSIETKGGKGADMTTSGNQKLGTGGGGSGGVLWLSNPSFPGNIVSTINGGVSGVCTAYGNDSWGATAGTNGINLLNLQIPITTVPFKPNIDSVRINSAVTGCSSFDFFGLGYTNTSPINDWQWYFGDGNTANTQNTSHTYLANGSYIVKLVVTDINGCKDSILTTVIAGNPFNFDFGYQQDVCDPLSVQFTGIGTDNQNPYWSFGDATFISGTINPIHVYPSMGSYIVKYSVGNGICSDTVTKTITLSVILDNIILTQDTLICYGTTKQLLTTPSLGFCWDPITYLNDPALPNPITSTPQDITYYFHAQVPGNNIIVNGDFSAGNTGFTSQYIYSNFNTTEGQYFISNDPQAWNVNMSRCPDHTSGTGNMMLVNGAPVPNVKVWSQTVPVLPNTNYAFSTWVVSLWPQNPALLQFSINNNNIGNPITASVPTCNWTQFYTTWNSGNNTTANISIVNMNTQVVGNDFALDDISFAPVQIKRDSVKITVEKPVVVATNNTTICESTQVQLNAAGAATYSWSPPTGLDDPAIPNPLANPPGTGTFRYIVTGTTLNNCTAKDTVDILINPKPLITKSNDDTICLNNSTQLLAGGGVTYSWLPTGSLDDPSAPNPVATPSSTTKYFVTVTGVNTCKNVDSINISVRSASAFSINPGTSICKNLSTQLNASGGDLYSWSPAGSLSDPTIFNPLATPGGTTPYSVLITDTLCGNSATLSTTIIVKPLPSIHASKSNDIDCSTPQSLLNATGAVTYSWQPNPTLSRLDIPNPVARPTFTTQYIVKGTDTQGCINYDSITVNVKDVDNGLYLMATGFTPDNNGRNDCYGIKYWGTILELEFSIYNRWGERIFFTKNPSDCWDGKVRGVLQDPAVFVYMIKAKTTCQPYVFRKGTFALIR